MLSIKGDDHIDKRFQEIIAITAQKNIALHETTATVLRQEVQAQMREVVILVLTVHQRGFHLALVAQAAVDVLLVVDLVLEEEDNN